MADEMNNNSTKEGNNIDEKMECPVCGSMIPVDCVFCPMCGVELKDEEEHTEEVRESATLADYLKGSAYQRIKNTLFGKLGYSRKDIKKFVKYFNLVDSDELEGIKLYMPKKVKRKLLSAYAKTIGKKISDDIKNSFDEKIGELPSYFVVEFDTVKFGSKKIRAVAREIDAEVVEDREKGAVYLMKNAYVPSNGKYSAAAAGVIFALNAIANYLNITFDARSLSSVIDSFVNYKEYLVQHLSGDIDSSYFIGDKSYYFVGTADGGIKRFPTYLVAVLASFIPYLRKPKQRTNLEEIVDVLKDAKDGEYKSQ